MEEQKRVSILVVEPSRAVRNGLRERLSYEGFEVDACEKLDESYDLASRKSYEILLMDGTLGSEHIGARRVGMFGGASPILLAVDPSREWAVEAVRNGAWDVVAKPVDMNVLMGAIRMTLGVREQEDILVGAGVASPRTAHRPENIQKEERSGIIGCSPAIERIKDMVRRIGPKEAWVMIMGPNGSGKELIAKWLHRKSPRAAGPFVEVNCAAIPSELIESELFGHEKGSFSSAIRQHKGKFEQANGGTLFLDEVGDMSLAAQAKVLRALQEQKVARVGGSGAIDVNVRVIAATNKDLVEEIAAGRFREDLYHRLSVIVIDVPPLDERADDIPLLVDHFIDKICADYGMEPLSIDPEAVELLQRRPWTGNIRELRNVVERLIVLCADRITPEDVLAYAAPLKSRA